MNILKDGQDGATGQEAKQKTKEEIHGCGEEDMQIVGVTEEDAKEWMEKNRPGN